MLDSGHLVLDISPSRYLLILMLLVFLLALVSIILLYNNTDPYLVLILSVLVALSMVRNIKSIDAVRRIYISSTGECSIVTPDGHGNEAHLLDTCYSSDWLTILAFRRPDLKKNCYFLILSDSIDSSMLKKLKSRIRTSLFSADA